MQLLLHACFDSRNIGLTIENRGGFKDVMTAGSRGFTSRVPETNWVLVFKCFYCLE